MKFLFSHLFLFALSGTLLISAGCTKNEETRRQDSSAQADLLTEKTVVIIGDSLTEGYGVPKEKAFPFLVEERFASQNRAVKVINSGISGSTSASAPDRVKWALQSRPDVIVLALGANDGLRGLSPSAMKQNLRKAIDMAQEAGTKVILFGMLMPPNFGKRYQQDYENAFKSLAKEKDVPFLPFLLEGVGGKKELNQADGIHPNEEGHKIMAETVFKFLKGQI